jgi:hypothetical protein
VTLTGESDSDSWRATVCRPKQRAQSGTQECRLTDRKTRRQEIRTKSKKEKDPGKEKGITEWDKARKESNKRRDGGDGKKGGGGANTEWEWK